MERIAYNRLIEWKNSPERKPLIVHGARQVGKTWLLKEFGRREYASLIYVNCDKEPFAAAHDTLKGVRFSLAPHRDQGWMRNVPLYAVGAFFRS